MADTEMRSVYAALALPGPGTLQAFQDLGRRRFQVILRTVQKKLKHCEDFDGLSDLCEQAIASRENGDFWSAELGLVQRYLREGNSVACMAQLALLTIEFANTETFIAHLPSRSDFYLGGHFFSAEGVLEVLKRGLVTTILSSRSRLKFERKGNVLKLRHASGDVVPPIATLAFAGRQIHVHGIDVSAHPREELPWPDFDELLGVAELAFEVTAIEDAFRCLSENTSYASWVCEAIRLIAVPKIHPHDENLGFFSSCSYPDRPGFVLLGLGKLPSEARPPWLAAADLVHEACHQYYGLLERFAPIVRTQATGSYFSALAQKRRQADRALAALHAAANMTRFHAISNPKRFETCQGANDTRNSTYSMIAELEDCQDFTEAGKSIYSNLVQALDSRLVNVADASTPPRSYFSK